MRISILNLGNGVQLIADNKKMLYPLGVLRAVAEDDGITLKHMASRKAILHFPEAAVEEPTGANLLEAISDVLNGTVD